MCRRGTPRKSGSRDREDTAKKSRLRSSAAVSWRPQVHRSSNGARPINKRDQPVRAFEPQADAAKALATSDDRKLLAVATRAAEVRIYETEKRIRETTIPKAPAPVLAPKHDGTSLSLGSTTGEVHIWDTASGKLIKSLIPVPVQPAAIAGE